MPYRKYCQYIQYALWCGMPKPMQYPHKRLLQIDDEMKRAIADYRFAHRFNTEADAIRALIKAGLGSELEPALPGVRVMLALEKKPEAKQRPARKSTKK